MSSLTEQAYVASPDSSQKSINTEGTDVIYRFISNRCGFAALSKSTAIIGAVRDDLYWLTSAFCTAFVLCEYFLHLPREVELFWKKGVTGASVLFLSNRYTSLLSAVIQNAATNLESEKASQSARQYQRSQSDSFSRRGRASSLIYVHSTVIQNVPCLRCIEVNNATIAIVVLPYIAWAGGSKIHLGSKHL